VTICVGCDKLLFHERCAILGTRNNSVQCDCTVHCALSKKLTSKTNPIKFSLVDIRFRRYRDTRTMTQPGLYTESHHNPDKGCAVVLSHVDSMETPNAAVHQTGCYYTTSRTLEDKTQVLAQTSSRISHIKPQVPSCQTDNPRQCKTEQSSYLSKPFSCQ
jgi:hypothetical protein